MANLQAFYTQATVDQNQALKVSARGDSSLSYLTDTILEQNYSIASNYYNFSSWNYSGNTLRTNFSNGASTTYTGTLSNPYATSGTANVSNISFNIPNTLTVSEAGSLNYQWAITNTGYLSFSATSGTINSFITTSKFPTSSAYYNSTFGNVSIGLSGNVSFSQNGSLTGTISSITETADKFLKNLTINGNFTISGNQISIGQRLADSTVAGNLTTYSETYYDGSYLTVDGQGGNVYLANKQALDVSLFANASNFSGNDTISINLPLKIYENWVIASGLGNDSITLKGGGGLLSTNAGSGNDTVALLDHNHSVDGGDGLDIVIYQGSKSQYQALKNSSGAYVISENLVVTVDTLTNIERLQFSDGNIALDLAPMQSAGEAALLLGAVLPGHLAFDASKQALIGSVIGLLDQGFTLGQLSGAILRLPVWDVLTGKAAPTTADIATYLVHNIYGGTETAAITNAAVAAMNAESGATQGNYLASLVASADNQTHVGLVGVQATGLVYLG